MHIASAILGTLGALAVGAGALIYFAHDPTGDDDAGMPTCIAFVFLVPGAALLLAALLCWVL